MTMARSKQGYERKKERKIEGLRSTGEIERRNKKRGETDQTELKQTKTN